MTTSPQRAYAPPQRCLGPCPTCGTGQVLLRTVDRRTHRVRELPEPLLAVTGTRYVCANGDHAALDMLPVPFQTLGSSQGG